MQNNPPFNSESNDALLSAEQQQDDAALPASSDEKASSHPIKDAPSVEAAPSVAEESQPRAASSDSSPQEASPAQARPSLPTDQNSSVASSAAASSPIQPPASAVEKGAISQASSPAAASQTQQVAPPVPGGPGAQVPPGFQWPQAGAVPVTPRPAIPPGYVLSQGYLVPQGYVVHQGYVVPQSYVQQGAYPPQPGAVPVTPQPGYVPQPGYIPQPMYVPQPGYVPPQQTLPPGYVPPPEITLPPQRPRPRLARDRTSLLAIAGAALAVLILLAIIVGVVTHQGNNNSTTSSVVPTISATPKSSLGQPTSAFQPANCPFEGDTTLIQNQQLSCGYVTVPENRNVKNSPKVKLAVAIFKAQQYINSVDPDPVIRLDGGPGGPSLSGWASAVTSSNYRALIFNHDVVMFDQRGTGYSTPSLNCPELLSYQDASMGGGTAYEQAAHTCYTRLMAQGIDLSSFNSLENAADVADIIHALGYPQMTLYGVSYGTRLALTTMRLYPSVVHAAVLDSVYPPDHNRADLTSDAQRVFNVLFQGCAKSSTCNTKYPNLQTVFYNLVDQLNAHPVSFYTVDANTNQQYNVTFAGDDLIGWVFSALYATSLIPVIPRVIYEVKAGQYFELSSLYSELIFDDTLSQGLFYSDECNEDWPFLTTQSISQSEQGIEPHLARVFGKEDEQQEYDICQFWKVGKAPDAQKQPVVSSIPTLITTGEYDPITPPANGQEAAKTLSHSYFFEFPGQGHGQLYSSSCSDQIISSFEDNPQVPPDGSCIGLMTEPQFL